MSNDPQVPNPPPPIPDSYVIPRPILERWLSIPENDYVTIRATRHDLDQLFFSILRSFEAQKALQDCIVEWSNGRIDQANYALESSRRVSAEGQNNIRHFFSSIMASAEPEKR